MTDLAHANSIRFKKLFRNYQKYTNLHISIHPKCQMELSNIALNFPKFFETINSTDYKYVCFDLNVFISDTFSKSLNKHIENMKDKTIEPFMVIPVYLPTYKNKLCVNSKNFNRAFIFLEAACLYYQQFDKEKMRFITPEINQETHVLLADETMRLVSYLLSEQKIGNIIEKELKEILDANVLDAVNFEMLPEQYHFEDFLTLPKTMGMTAEDNKYMYQNTGNAQYVERFLKHVHNLFEWDL